MMEKIEVKQNNIVSSHLLLLPAVLFYRIDFITLYKVVGCSIVGDCICFLTSLLPVRDTIITLYSSFRSISFNHYIILMCCLTIYSLYV